MRALLMGLKHLELEKRIDIGGWLLVAVLCVIVPSVAIASSSASGAEIPLIDAAKNSDSSAVQALLEQQPDSAKLTEPDGTSALHYAANRSDLATVQFLLAAGASVDVMNRYGVRPLALAVESGYAPVVKELLKAGADANSSQFGGETLLMTAARTGDPETVRLLLEYGADVHAKEETRGQTALMWGAVNGNAAAIAELLAAGADVHARSYTPEKPDKPRGASMWQPDKNEAWYDESITYGALTSIAFATRRGHLEAVGALLDGGANADDVAIVMHSEPPTPILTLAIANAHYELAAYLLDRGADPNLATNGWSALHQLARARSEPAKKRTNVGWTEGPNMTGNISGLDLATKLIEKGANVDARMTREFNDFYRLASYVSRVDATPLLMAARVSDAPLMRLLLEAGADPTLPSADGITPLMSAAGSGIRSPMEDGIDKDSPEALRLMLDIEGLDVNQVDKRGWTALHGAAYRGSLPVIQMLVDHGANLNVRTNVGDESTGRKYTDLGLNKTGWLPVHIADGIVVGGIFFRQVPGAALLRTLMEEQGLPIPLDEGLMRGTYQADDTTEQRLLKDGRTRPAYGGFLEPVKEDDDPEDSTIKKQ